MKRCGASPALIPKYLPSRTAASTAAGKRLGVGIEQRCYAFAPVSVTDAHIHVQPWWEMNPAMLEAMTRGRPDLDELHKIMKSLEQLLRRLDADGIERAVLVNYPSELMGFGHRVNDYVADYCGAAPERLIAMGGVHPRMAEDAAAEV